MKTALEQPPSKLALTPKKPDFSIDIREREQPNRFMTPILDFKVAPGVPLSAISTSPFGSQPLFKIDLLPMMIAGASAARKAFATHVAREEVRRSIAAYCAAQPDRGAGIQICEGR